jgi:septal ring factor EnvC (AmiA/AmiB activator)
MLTPKEELIDTYNFRHKNLARLEKQLKNAKTREEKAEIQYWINSVKKEIKDIEKELIEKFNFKPSIKA